MNGTTAYILSKKRLIQSLNGIGALAGAPAQIESILKTANGNEVTFKWQGNDGSIQYSTMTVLDGLSSVKAEFREINGDTHFIIILSDNSELDAGIIPTGESTTDFSLDANTGQLLYKGMEINIARTNGYCIQSVTLEEYNRLLDDKGYDKKTIYIIEDDNTSNSIENCGFSVDENNQLMHNGKYVDVATVNNFTIQRITKEEYDKLKESGTSDHNCLYIIDDDNTTDMESRGFYLNENNQLMYNGTPVDAATVDNFSIKRVSKEIYMDLKENGTADPECIYLIDDDTSETVIS